MLDKAVAVATTILAQVRDKVHEQREKWETKRGRDPLAQAYNGTALKHPEGHTTALRKSAERAQQEYAKVREEWEAIAPQAAGVFVAMQIARERRDESRAVFRRHDADELRRQATHIHIETRRVFGRLCQHGVTPAMLEQLPPEIIGIIADIILWQASDRYTAHADSPIPAIYDIYANRLLEDPHGRSAGGRSVPGVPVVAGKYARIRHYMFADVVRGDPAADVVVQADEAAVEQYDDVGTDESDTNDTERAAPDGLGSPVEDQKPSEQLVEEVVEENRCPNNPGSSSQSAEPQIAAGPLDLNEAERWAETMVDQLSWYTDIYWPPDYEKNNFDSPALEEALEKWISGGQAFGLAAPFLDACRAGEGREFMADKRDRRIHRLAQELLAGEEAAMRNARLAGLIA